MIREEFLVSATKRNLKGLRLMKDVCVVCGAGVRPCNLGLLQFFDRFKIHYEMLLSECVESAAGLVEVKGDGCYLTGETLNAEARSHTLSGISVNLRITALEKQLLVKSAPPVGKLPYLFDRQLALSKRAAELTGSLLDVLGKVYAESVDNKLSTGYPLSFLEAMTGTASRYADAAQAAGRQQTWEREPDEEDLFKAAGYLVSTLDPFYERKLIASLTEVVSARDRVRLASAAADFTAGVLKGRVKSTALPLVSDMIQRMSYLS